MKTESTAKPVSIVVNTLNRAGLLNNTLSSFRHLDYENFEVIVVNGPSTDTTEQLLLQWEDKIRIGKCPEANLSMSRNIGIAMAAGEFVAFIDDDAIPEPEWLDQAVMGFDSDDVGATGGKVFDHTGYTYQYQYANATRLGNGKWQLARPCPHFCFPGSFEFPYVQGTNAIFRRSALLEIGGFDEEFVYYLDETDVCLRLIDAGYLIRQLPDAYVHHKFAPSHIREKGVAKYRYPVLKSKIYFSNRYGNPYCSQEEIDMDNRDFVQLHRNDVLHCVTIGKLSREDHAQFEQQVTKAEAVAIEASRQPRKLLASELLERHAAPFKRFPTIRPEGEQLTIALLCEDYPPNLLGGIARFTHDKAVALARLGHKVHVIARGHGHNTVDFEEGVWVHRILAEHRLLSPEAAAMKIPQSHWDQSKSFLDELDRISTHRPIDVVEAPVWNVVGIAPLLAGGYRVITSLQTTLKLSLPSRPDLTRNPEAMESFVLPVVAAEKYLIEHSNAVLAISRGITDEVEAAYDTKIGNDRLFISHLGMPDWADKESSCAKENSEAIKVLFVGRLETRKGIDVLLESIPPLCARHPKAEFHIVGDDTFKTQNGRSYRAIFQKKYPALCRSRVVFHGKVDEAELRRHYADCDIFVAPSRFESFGLIYLEAMMFSKPVVGCRVGGIPEVVLDGETGLLTAPGDAVFLEKAIDTLLKDPALRQRLGRNGRLRYEQGFTDDQMARSCLALYENLRDACTRVDAPEFYNGKLASPFTHLACPACKSSLKLFGCSVTESGRVKFGSLLCECCNGVAGKVRFGKADFLRLSDTGAPQLRNRRSGEFVYKRVAWSDASISTRGLSRRDMGWNAEGFTGCLVSEEKDDWEIVIETNATDLGIRCLSHASSGVISVALNREKERIINLYDPKESGVKCHILFQDLAGSKTVRIRPARSIEPSYGNKIFFFGYDACFPGASTRQPVNRGNQFPAMYQWALANLPANALLLDCGSGDRDLGDARVIKFEYLPFELPDIFGDGHALPFKDATFDVVFSQAVMEHMRDPFLAAREITRILKPGGLVYAESAFMQPLHAVPYHFFNTSPWGIEELFLSAGIAPFITEWFGALSESVRWYLDSCGGGGLTQRERETVLEHLRKADANTNYENLKAVASAVAFWGIKPGAGSSTWKSLLATPDRPTFRY